MRTEALYDTIGLRYARTRREDPRIARALWDALGAVTSVVNVGAGAGSYEPRDRFVVAAEPSQVMIQQRSARAAPAVQAGADALPFSDGSFDASLAVLTIHHWPDLGAGLAELMRVARDRVVVLTHDPGAKAFWLNDYFPEIVEIDGARLPALRELEQRLGEVRVVDVPVPHDCLDGFLCAYWRRPEAYLFAAVRAGISCFAEMSHVEEGTKALARDLESGAWKERYGHLSDLESIDLGYRIVMAEKAQ